VQAERAPQRRIADGDRRGAEVRDLQRDCSVIARSLRKRTFCASLAMPEMLQLRRLAQAGFVLRGSGTTIAIDVFLSPRADRLVPPSVLPEDFVGLDAILATHQHRDHLDLPALEGLVAASPAAQVVVPAPITELVAPLVTASRITGALVDREIRVGQASITPVPARHGVTMADAYTFGLELSGGLHRHVGYVIELAGVRVYHAGDTIRYDGMGERLRDLRVDLALLPINGRSAEREARGLVGNLDHIEAADLAVDAGIPVLIPMHHDTIDGNTGSVEELREYVRAKHLELRIVEIAPFAEIAWPPS
jgi:L-ascorbate metabolism protein UlaG (beta-lactamase superfamily)